MRSLLLFGLLVTVNIATSAQPTCFTMMGTEHYCDQIYGANLFVGRVVSLTPSGGSSMLNAKAAKIEVIDRLKGDQKGTIEVSLPSHCAGHIEAGKMYFFAADKRGVGEQLLTAHHWAPLDELESAVRQSFLDGVRSLVRGERQDSVWGTVTRFDTHQPLAGITIIAKTEKAEEPFRTMTDREGKFAFPTLPAGDYKVFPDYPDSIESADRYDGMQTIKEVHHAYVVENPEYLCGTKIDFTASSSSSISVVFPSIDKDSYRYPKIELVAAPPRIGSFDRPEAIRDSAAFTKDEGSDQPRFTFRQIQPGKYIVRVVVDRWWENIMTFYYPGVRQLAEAKVITVRPGEKVDVSIDLPDITKTPISGKIRLADGREIYGGIRLVDNKDTSLSSTISRAGPEMPHDGRFYFEYLRGMPFNLCAGFDGTFDGKPIRLYTNSKGHVSTDDKTTVDLVLNTPIPVGKYWWQLCN